MHNKYHANKDTALRTQRIRSDRRMTIKKLCGFDPLDVETAPARQDKALETYHHYCAGIHRKNRTATLCRAHGIVAACDTGTGEKFILA